LAEIQQVLLMMAASAAQRKQQNARGDKNLRAEPEEPTRLGEKDKRPQIRQIIDAIYQKDNKYMRKPKERSSFLNANDIIFDLSRAAKLNNMVNADEQLHLDPLSAQGKRVLKRPTKNAKVEKITGVGNGEHGHSLATFI